MHKPNYFLLLVLLLSVVLAACAGTPTQPLDVAPPTPSESQVEIPTEVETVAEDALAIEEAGEDPASSGDPIEEIFAAPITAAGDLVIIFGRVLDVNGDPLEGASVEFWQTDASGVYDHPGDAGTNNRDLGFQFYGAAVTNAAGTYIFRTIRPGQYEPRPPHIHFKVKWNGTELLTSQIYFADAGSEGGTSPGVDTDPLMMEIEQVSAGDGAGLEIGVFDIVVDTGVGAGSLSLTPGQGEGPYYPVVTVGDYDNDLASVND